MGVKLGVVASALEIVVETGKLLVAHSSPVGGSCPSLLGNAPQALTGFLGLLCP